MNTLQTCSMQQELHYQSMGKHLHTCTKKEQNALIQFSTINSKIHSLSMLKPKMIH